MSSETAISIRGLAKSYRITNRGLRLPTFRDVVMERIRHPFRKAEPETFWALNDVSFDIKKGEVVGIIGRNGAGKSTLLKILSRIVEPTAGAVDLFGHVGSLLEVGTGFHSELTGRENIFLNGAILGMRRHEIREQFDAIVEFAGVERFLDTPVKRYSSGMYVRLAFAVAAHLNPEVLLVDEVLAVGDVEFQKKCLGKMGEVAREGRTVLFVSHNMAAVEQLCKRVVWLDKGRVFRDSEDVGKLCREYVFGDNQESTLWVAPDAAVGNSYFDLRRVALEKEDGSLLPNGLTSNDDNIYLVIEADVHELDRSLIVGYTVLQEDGQTVYTSAHTDVDQASWPEIVKGKNVLKTRIPPRFLNEGIYTVEVFACLHNRFWILEPGTSGPAVTLSISGGMSDSPYWYARRPGVTAPVLTWEAAVEERLRVS